MSLQSYLHKIATQGKLDSNGRFTLDLERAAKLQATFNQRDPYHCLLKMVQVAHRTGAPRLSFNVKAGEVTVGFQSHTVAALEEISQVLDAVTQVDESVSPILADLRGALLGALGLGISVKWSRTCNERIESIELGRGGKMTVEEQPSRALQEESERRWNFEIKLSSRWRFWEIGGRVSRLKSLLSLHCPFSRVELLVNSDEIERGNLSCLNDHLKEFHRTHFNAAIGAMQNLESRVAPSCLLFETASLGFAVTSPNLDGYVARDDHYVWKQALRANNPYRPDNNESPAWVLTFGNGAEMSSKLLTCKLVLATNLHGPGNQEPVKVKLVRWGVTILEARITDEELNFLRGCSLILHDEELPTDLSGLKAVKSTELLGKLKTLEPLVRHAQDCFSQEVDRISWA